MSSTGPQNAANYKLKVDLIEPDEMSQKKKKADTVALINVIRAILVVLMFLWIAEHVCEFSCMAWCGCFSKPSFQDVIKYAC